MADKIEVKFASAIGEDVVLDAQGTIQVFTPSGQVFISYDEVTKMMMVVVRGEKSTTAVKFNEKAVV